MRKGGGTGKKRKKFLLLLCYFDFQVLTHRNKTKLKTSIIRLWHTFHIANSVNKQTNNILT